MVLLKAKRQGGFILGFLALALAWSPRPAMAQATGGQVVRLWVNNERFNIYRPTLLIEGDTISVNVVVTDSAGSRRPDVPVRFRVSEPQLVETTQALWNEPQLGYQGSMQGLMVRALKPGLVSVFIEAGGKKDSVRLDIRPRVARECQGKIAELNMAVGSIKRWRTEDPGLPGCLWLNKSEAGHEYLLTVEYTPKDFLYVSGQPGQAWPDRVNYQILASSEPGMRGITGSLLSNTNKEQGLLGTTEPKGEAGVEIGHAVLASPEILPISSVAVNDTLRLPELLGYNWPQGIKRDQRVVVKYLGRDLILAESVENFERRLMRPDSTFAMPIPDSLYARFDSAFGFGKRQLDRVFRELYKSTLLGQAESRPIVVNLAMMPNSWGGAGGSSGTGDVSGYVMLDFWATTHGRSVSPYYQNPDIIAPRLIAHELAHVRHQDTYKLRGQMWFFEGFGAYIEDLAISAATMRRDSLSLLANLPYREGVRLTNGNAFSPDASVLYGYGNSSYFFDYVTGLAAVKGMKDPFLPVRQMLAADGSEASYDPIAQSLAGTNIDQLLWQSRAAILLDDRSVGLPAWTQYPDVSAPQGLAPMRRPLNILPGESFSSITDMVRGGIQGYFIDATKIVPDQLIFLGLGAQPGMAVTVTRLR